MRPPVLYTTDLAPGDAGTHQTLEAMRVIARRSADHPRVRELAIKINSTRPRSLYRLYDWARAHVVFSRDPPGEETIRLPEFILEEIEREGTAAGDCDDLATLLAAVLLAMGYRPFYAVVGRQSHGRYEHVFTGFLDGDKLYSLDPQEGVPIGQWPGSGRRAVMLV